MTTTPARPDFIQTRVGLACPAPSCNKTYVYKAAAEKHWDTHHAAFVGDDPGLDDLMPEQPQADTDQGDDEEEFSEEVEALHAMLYGPTDEQDDEQGEEQLEDDDEQGERPDPAPLATHLLTPEEIQHRTGWPCRIDPDAVLALSDATTSLVDAITRLIACGFDRNRAVDVVTDLIDKLHDTPAAPAA